MDNKSEENWQQKLLQLRNGNEEMYSSESLNYLNWLYNARNITK